MRFLPLTAKDRESMLAAIGAKSIDDLYGAVPAAARPKGLLDLPKHQGEMEIFADFAAMANKNHSACKGPFFLGAGCYNHYVPAAVDAMMQRGEFLTAYTPYQPEISQGTLMVIFEFQSMIAALTGMDVANASMYDGATAVTEAALMAQRVTKRPNIRIRGALNPQYREVLDTYMRQHDCAIFTDGKADDQTACVIVQTPDFHGNPQALEAIRKECDESGAMLVVAVTEIVSLGLLPAPKEADIVAGEAQSIGVGMSYGGPHLGFFACKEKFIRQMPGRLCGQTVDADGKRGFVLTLVTREQHIRREKATSNICTNQGLMALAFTIHLSLLGESGLKHLARLNHERACTLADKLEKAGFNVENTNFFNEFVVQLKKPANDMVEKLTGKGIIAGLPLDGNRLLVTATEVTRESDMDALISGLKEVA
ncbi:MAG: aminomethyl-transferring glycine dehydrogenase subunit GcvPA [Alphaproteobacteria bacterium]|nr:aminomethyl-transferring glycine dehydrogenase subunit GcvPA [Alphaproteobacteria bacterium]